MKELRDYTNAGIEAEARRRGIIIESPKKKKNWKAKVYKRDQRRKQSEWGAYNSEKKFFLRTFVGGLSYSWTGNKEDAERLARKLNEIRWDSETLMKRGVDCFIN